jgi:hypothetical protein
MLASSKDFPAPVGSRPLHRSAPVPAPTQSHDLQAGTEALIAACDGDPRSAVRTLLVAVIYLEAEVERLAQAVSRGYVRGQLRQEPPTVLASAPNREQS